jgi:rod shape determining protein RodA
MGLRQLDLQLSASRATFGERPTGRYLDITLLGAAIGLAVAGLMMVYSATHRSLAEFGLSPSYFLRRQVIFGLVGLVGLVVAALIDYRMLRIYAPFLFIFGVALLLLVRTPLGSSALGAQRWFQVGGFQFSPSLFMRLGLVLMLATVLSQIKVELQLRHVLRITIIAAIPMFLVFAQPDIGTTIILSFILLALLVAAGTKVRYLVVLALIASVAIFGAFQLHVVKDYQIARLTSFLQSNKDLRTANYNKQQAEIAIGSGGIAGRGYLHGTQTNLDFVPQQHTDFIFTVIGEEFGFIGAVVVLFLFALLLWRCYRIALTARDPFGTFLAVGVGAMFAIQVFVNVGMTIGIMPITGIPLPFISYGGSALISDLIGVGVLLNVYRRRAV